MEEPELASTDQRSKRRSFPLPKAAPWLVTPYGKGEKFQSFYNICEPNNTSCRKFIPELKGKSAYQKNSHQGWLIILCDDDEFDYTPWNYGDCFLLNPLTMESIELPSFVYWYTLDGYCLSDCLLSSPPKSRTSTNVGGNGNSMVFMLFSRKDKPVEEILVFCYPGDKEWRTHKFSDISGVGNLPWMSYFKDKLYITLYGEKYLEIDIQHASEPVLSISKIDVSYNIKYDSIGGIFDSRVLTYYVESADEIFMIRKFFIIRGVYQDCVTNMVISKLDFLTMSCVEVTSLDDHVLFISSNTRLCCSAKELGLTRGCVYFTQPGEMILYKYDLEDKTIMLSQPCPDLPKPWFSPNWLMIPTTFWNADARRGGTESMPGSNSNRGNNSKAIEKSSSAVLPVNTKTSNDDEKEDIEEAWPWYILTEDIVRLIAYCLSPLDYMHLRAVCRSYRSVFPLVNWRRFCSTKNLQAPVLSPWLVFAKDNESIYSFINPMHNDESYLTSIPDILKGSTIRFSKGGWLLMSKGKYSVFFYNPFTKAIIKLPVLPDGCNYLFRGICFSSLPTSSDCTVFAISSYVSDSVCISFIKRGDKTWTYESRYENVYLPPNRTNMKFEASLNTPIFYNGAFCCLDVNGTLGVFTSENVTRWEVLSMVPPPNCGFIYRSYLVELEGKLLSVLLGHYGKWVRIFRLDMSKMVWVEVENLGRHVLFISNTSCIATIAQTSRMENKIYFPRLQNQGILFYSLDSGKYHSLEGEYYGRDYCNSKDNLRCSWIEPNWPETTKPNFDWS